MYRIHCFKRCLCVYGLRDLITNIYEYEMLNMEDDEVFFNDDYFYPLDFEDDISELVDWKNFFKMFMELVMQVLILQHPKNIFPIIRCDIRL